MKKLDSQIDMRGGVAAKVKSVMQIELNKKGGRMSKSWASDTFRLTLCWDGTA
jgi:hypothetical protein